MAKADAEGRAVEISGTDPERRPDTRSGQVKDGVIYLSRAHAREVARYRAAKERAEREGLTVEILD